MKYKHVFTRTDKINFYVYEANIQLYCGICKKDIPVNSIFTRANSTAVAYPVPACRECRPFTIYDEFGNAVKQEDEQNHVYDTIEQLSSVIVREELLDTYEKFLLQEGDEQ